MKRELNIFSRLLVSTTLILSGCGIKNSIKTAEAIETPTPITSSYNPTPEDTKTPTVLPTVTVIPTLTTTPTEQATITPIVPEFHAGIPATMAECNQTPTTPEQWEQYNAVLKAELAKRTIVEDIDPQNIEDFFAEELPYGYIGVFLPPENILGCSVEKNAEGKPISLTR